MVILLPVVLLLLVFAILGNGTNLVLLLPTVVVLAAGVLVVAITMRAGRTRRHPSVPTLPTDHLSRQMDRALRPDSLRRRRGRDVNSE